MLELVPASVSDDDIDAGVGRPYPVDDAAEEEDLESKRRYAWFGLGSPYNSCEYVKPNLVVYYQQWKQENGVGWY
jgi:hypothetical protein